VSDDADPALWAYYEGINFGRRLASGEATVADLAASARIAQHPPTDRARFAEWRAVHAVLVFVGRCGPRLDRRPLRGHRIEVYVDEASSFDKEG
jgi:hypothetical protein